MSSPETDFKIGKFDFAIFIFSFCLMGGYVGWKIVTLIILLGE